MIFIPEEELLIDENNLLLKFCFIDQVSNGKGMLQVEG
jgi:hypothetical protein